MKVVILGAGIAGITAAYRLMEDGHDVTVVERGTGVGQDTSWGNAGLISTGHAFAWGNPAFLLAGIRGLLGRGGLAIEDGRNPEFWRWALRFVATCTPARERDITRRKHRLCLASQALWRETLAEARLDVPHTTTGALYLYRDAAALARADRMAAILRANGQDLRLVGPDVVLRLDPGLAGMVEGTVGALHAPGDGAGPCHAFVTALADHLVGRGLDLRLGTEAVGLVTQGARVTGAWTSAGGIAADAVVIALGPHAQPFLARHGLAVPVYPVRGTSLTLRLPAGAVAAGPRLPGVDKALGVAWRLTGLADHAELRLTTGAAFAGLDARIDPADIARLDALARRLMPGFDLADAPRTPWAGFRPLTPTGLPIVRQARPGLWLNIGHGHMGWTMAHATARQLAEALAGRPAPDWAV
jgi:D-amino-acid dehydrogenase